MTNLPALLLSAAVSSSTGWPLVWSDEFDGPAGSRPSATRWTAETGGHGWGNAEHQHYTDRVDNSRHDGQGHLIIEARKEKFGKNEFTSARLVTREKFSRTYGRFSARLKLPKGRGLWPAFWMMGTSITTEDWPACGEIDVMEFIGHEPGAVHGTLHGPCYSGADGIGGSFRLPGTSSFPDGFHEFAVEWEPAEIRWLVDGVVYRRTTPADLNGRVWVYDRPFFLLLNLAVGGHWPGPPDATTPFPARVIVDWIRVHADPGFPPPTTGARPAAALFTPPALRVPGVIEAEHFDAGGEGTGYHDSDGRNQGCELRNADAVDLERCADSGTGYRESASDSPSWGYDVGWTAPGEWLAYTATVAASGTYTLAARVASEPAGGTFHLELGGQDLTGPLQIPATGGWQTWTTVTSNPFRLPAGRRTLRLVFDAAGPAGSCGNLNRLEFLKR